MPIDPSIALGVKPVELGNPLERYMQLQQIQGAQNQNRLADLMYGEKQQQVARAQSLRTLANSWDANTTDEQVRDSLRNNGFFDEADKYETMLQNRAKTKSEVGKNDAEAQAKHIDTLTKVNGLIGSAAGAVVQNPNYDTAVQLVNGLRQQLGPDISKQLGLDTLEIPRDPVKLKDWAQGHYTASIDTEKQLADARAAFEGNANRKSQQQIAAGHDATTRRGQDLTDARARDQLEAGRNQVVQSDNGPVLVNNRTGVGVPVTVGGKPVPSKEANQRVQDAKSVIDLLDMAEPLLNKATSSLVGQGVDRAAAAFGKSTEGAQAAAQLRALEGALISKMPKMSGPQSDKDVLLYRQMAGQIGDPSLPIETRRAALQTVRALNERYAGQSERPTPTTNAKGWTLHTDARGNKAYVSPDGKSYEEVK